jgi:HEAT repeat protein
MNASLFLLLQIALPQQADQAPPRAQPTSAVSRAASARLPTPEADAAALALRTAELAELGAALQLEAAAPREAAAARLAKLAAKDVMPHARAALRSESADVRLTAVTLLGKLPYGAGAREIERVLDLDRVPEVRREACHALLDAAPRAAHRALFDAARDDDELFVRRAAINDLGRLRSSEGADALVLLLEDAMLDEDEYVADLCQKALTMATGKTLKRNLEGWRAAIADMRKQEEQRAARERGDVETLDEEVADETEGSGEA